MHVFLRSTNFDKKRVSQGPTVPITKVNSLKKISLAYTNKPWSFLTWSRTLTWPLFGLPKNQILKTALYFHCTFISCKCVFFFLNSKNGKQSKNGVHFYFGDCKEIDIQFFQ